MRCGLIGIILGSIVGCVMKLEVDMEKSWFPKEYDLGFQT